MTITFTDGTITTSAAEQSLFDTTADSHFACWIFLNAMTSTETFRIRAYVKDQNGATMRVYKDETITGAQDPPSFYIPFVATKEFKVTIIRTAGTDRAVAWQRIEVS